MNEAADAPLLPESEHAATVSTLPAPQESASIPTTARREAENVRRSLSISNDPSRESEDEIAHRGPCRLRGEAAVTRFDAMIGTVDHDQVLAALRSLRWAYDDFFAPDLAFFEELTGQVDDWVVVLPQLGKRGLTRALPKVGVRSLFPRKRTRGPLFQNISDPKHRYPVRRIAGAIPPYGDTFVDGLEQPRRAAVLVYPVIEGELDPPRSDDEIDSRLVVMGLTLVAPAASVQTGAQLVQFVARNKAQEKTGHRGHSGRELTAGCSQNCAVRRSARAGLVRLPRSHDRTGQAAMEPSSPPTPRRSTGDLPAGGSRAVLRPLLRP